MKLLSFLKNKFIFILFFIIGIILTDVIVYASTTISSNLVEYSDDDGTITVQNAIDSLYGKIDIRKAGRFVAAYKYSTETSTKCITGKESTCVSTNCYKSTSTGSCPVGTIIKYKVNDTSVVVFHVMYDAGDTLTMQSQKNIVYNTAWYSSNDNTKGPLTILNALESATAGWTNVNNHYYDDAFGFLPGVTNYTGCTTYNNCDSYPYVLTKKTKARLLSVQEAVSLGCTIDAKSCPIWMYNYLDNSVKYGGTVDDTNTSVGASSNTGYWTMTAASYGTSNAWFIYDNGSVFNHEHCYTSDNSIGARAVVEVSKSDN